jgi:hypothetical protein
MNNKNIISCDINISIFIRNNNNNNIIIIIMRSGKPLLGLPLRHVALGLT